MCAVFLDISLPSGQRCVTNAAACATLSSLDTSIRNGTMFSFSERESTPACVRQPMMMIGQIDGTFPSPFLPAHLHKPSLLFAKTFELSLIQILEKVAMLNAMRLLCSFVYLCHILLSQLLFLLRHFSIQPSRLMQHRAGEARSTILDQSSMQAPRRW